MAGSLNPTDVPGPTMHSLEEIYQKVNNLAPQTLQSFADTTVLVNAGYYAATNLALVDTDMVAENIKTNVTIFGVAGTLSIFSAAVPKTGQTTSYQAGDAGSYQKGVPWPTPRFTVGASGEATNCVTDNMTGLMWARNANIGGTMTWSNAIVYCEGLTYGGYSDWRQPNRRELQSLTDDGRASPALIIGHPFTGVQLANYWTSSTDAGNSNNAWYVLMVNGLANIATGKTGLYYVWPVRGGQ